MAKTNIESQEDFDNYLAYLSDVEKEVDKWSEEDKSQRATSFHADLAPQREKVELPIENNFLKNDSHRTPSIDL